MESVIKVLYILPSLDYCNGMASYAMNYYKHISKEEVKFDFIVAKDCEDYKADIDPDSKIFVIPNIGLNNVKGYFQSIDRFFKENHDYAIVHCHVPNAATFYLPFAKKYGIPIRILHSHVTKSSDRLLRKIRNDIFAPIANRYSNEKAACSSEAGHFLFGNHNFQIIPNAISIERYNYDEKIRDQIRKELKIDNKVVIGFVGRICDQKNPILAIEIFSEIHQREKNSILLMIGDGYLLPAVKEKAKKLNILDSIIFLKPRNNVWDYYQAMDALVVPSKYEGLGMVFVEAQISGLIVFTSTNVTRMAAISQLMNYESLDTKASIWAEHILNKICNQGKRYSHIEEGIEHGFDIEKESGNLVTYYRNLIAKYKIGEGEYEHDENSSDGIYS